MATQQTLSIVSIPVTMIVPDPENLRSHFDPQDVETLGQNLLEHGQLDPVQVFERGDGTYDLYDGERRWQAAQAVGIEHLDAIQVPRPSSADLICKKVSRALQTRNLTPHEELVAMQAALEALGVRREPKEWGQVAKRLGISPQLLRDRMRITNLTPKVRNEFDRGQLDLSAAQAIGRLEDEGRQVEVADFVEKNHLHTRFVGTKFISKLVQHPEKPVEEVYTIALSEQRSGFRISGGPKEPDTIVDRLEDILADLRRSETWLVAAGRESLIDILMERGDSMGLTRLSEAVDRLGALCQSFARATQNRPDHGIAFPSPKAPHGPSEA